MLPPGRLGWRLLDRILAADAGPLAAAALERAHPAGAPVDVDVDLGGGRRLRGTVPEVYGDRLVPVSYSRLGPKHRLQSWVALLALAAADADRSWTAPHHRPPGSRAPATTSPSSLLGPLDHARRATAARPGGARATAACASRCRCRSRRRFRYARLRRTQRRRRRRPCAKARLGLDGRQLPRARTSDAAHVRVWGAQSPAAGLGRRARAGEEFPGETARFGPWPCGCGARCSTSRARGSW